MAVSPAELKVGMRVRIDTDITAYAPDPSKSVERQILEIAKHDGAIRISEGWFTPRRVLSIASKRGSSTQEGAR